MKITVSPAENLAALLKEEVQDILGVVNAHLQSKVRDLADETAEKIKKIANDRLTRTRQQYKDAVSVVDLGGGSFSVVLDASASHLEEGYDSFDMKPGLLRTNLDADGLNQYNSGKQGKIRTSKDGFRYRAIPMDQERTPAAVDHPLHNAKIRIGKADQQTMGSLAQDLKHMLNRSKKAGFDKMPSGSRIVPYGGNMNQMIAIKPGQSMADAASSGQAFSLGQSMGGSSVHRNPLLDGLTKFQYKSGNRTQNAYITFRMVSEKQAMKWIHPGFDGVKAFDKVHLETEMEFEKIVNEIFSESA